MRLGWLLAKRYPGRSAPSNDESGGPGDAETLDVSDVRSLGFWISNALTIVATVLGVYLAASEGFKQALQFRQVEENEHTFDLLTSLKAEITHNRALTGELVDKGLEQLPQSWEKPPVQQRYIWQTMQNVPETFRAPPVALNGIALYYSRLDEHLEVAFNQRRHPSDQRNALLALQEANAEFDQTVLTAINAKMAELRSKLETFGINPDE